VKSSVQVPVMVAGRINQPQEAERLLESRACDAVVMTRALICDPQLPAKARGGAGEEIRACVGCNQACIGHFQSGHPISCIQYPESGRELLYPRSRARRPKSVGVIGGGPGGLKVASVAALRGHSVHLFERDRQLGGAVRIAALIAGREEFGGVAQNLEGEARRAGVTITVGTHVRGGDVACLGADEVVVATGAQAYRGDLHILGEPHILGANEVLTGSGFSPGHVVVYDSRGDWVGVGCAVALRERGHRVSLAYSGVSVGERLQQYVRDEHILRVLRLGIETVPLVRLFGADSTSVYFQHVLSEEMVEIGGVCGLVTATGYRPATTLCDELDAAGIIYHTIGDALSPRSVEEAVLEGLKVGSAL
jgi:thioredoxin reductase